MLPIVLLIAAITTCLCAAELLGVRYHWLAHRRRRDSFRSFQAHFRHVGVHVEVLVAVQDYFQQLTSVRGFPIRPGDHLLKMYGMHEEDVRDAVAAIAAGAQCLSPELLDGTASPRLATVEDLVHEMHRLHREYAELLAPAAARRQLRAI